MNIEGYNFPDDLYYDKNHFWARVDGDTVEMGATVQDLAESVHPHPTLSETLMEAAEVFYGHSTHMYTRRKTADEVTA